MTSAASPWRRHRFHEDVRLHKNYLLGDEEGKGFQVTMRTIDCLRAFGSLESLAKAQTVLDETVEYVKQRVQFGKPIAKFQGTSFRIPNAPRIWNSAVGCATVFSG
jgi:alkylation response protein AidB-like acyl-CoA dehydrogenase